MARTVATTTTTRTGDPLLTVDDLRVAGPDGRALLRGVHLTVPRGARTALVGASGAGKTLTTAAVLGTLPPGLRARGRVVLDGRDVLAVPGARRPATARPAAVRQDSATALHPVVPVGRQLRLVTTRRRALDLLAEVGLDDPAAVARAVPAELSGGQRQRVCLALALAAPGRLLVADEPTTALDVVTQAGVVDLLRTTTGGPTGRSLLLVTHDLAVAAQLCDEVVVLHGGADVQHGPAADVLHAPAHPRAAGLARAARALEAHLPPRAAPVPLAS